MEFTKECTFYSMAERKDTGPCGSCVAFDLTKPLFMQFAPLSQGVISNMRATNNTSCC
jgi:hypothetical protein